MRTGDWMRAALRDEWDGLGSIWRDLRAADVATLANALLGLAAIVMAARGETVLAIELVLLGVIVDGVDGFVARLGYGGGPLGPTLDTLADVVTFGVAPAVIIFQGTIDPWPWTVAAVVFYACAVLLRLARFEAIRGNGPRRYFSGLSSPGGALTALALMFYGVGPAWVAAALAGVSLLMLSRVRYPKLLGPLGLAAVAVILAVLLGHGEAWQPTALLGMLAFMALYLMAGPFYVLARHGPAEV